MTHSPAMTEQLLTLWGDVAALSAASAVLGWDQETQMPPKGLPARGRTMAALAGLVHAKLTDPALDDAIAAVEAAPADDVAATQARLARRAVRRASAVPADLARAMAETQSRALGTWQQAKADDDVAAFAPDLAEIVRLTLEQADAYVAAGLADTRYDALVDEYEPGWTEAMLAPLLGAVRDELTPIVAAAVDSGIVVDTSVCGGVLPVDQQEAFGRFVAAHMGYDFDAGRLDTSAHPFTTGFAPTDVRITWRADDGDLRPGLFGIMHEAGHALYEQGLPVDLAGTPAGEAVSLGVHESQSRLWENLVGRSRSFWRWAMPHLVDHVPGAAVAQLPAGDRVDALWPALHTVQPSLIRVEADEATYNLHIAVRFELERRLIGGELDAGDLPGAWDDTYEALLGIRPTSAADGVLQDIHWAMGAFGYFPTYTLGNLAASQLFEAAAAALGDLDDQLAAGDLEGLLGWLRTNVHRHASTLDAPALIEQATGAPLTADAFMRHIRADVAEVYG